MLHRNEFLKTQSNLERLNIGFHIANGAMFQHFRKKIIKFPPMQPYKVYAVLATADFSG